MKKNIYIGATIAIALFLLVWGIEFLKGVNMFKPANYYYAQFEKIDGLVDAAPVTINGFQVGQVREINYDYATNRITVMMSMNKDLKIPEGSLVYVKSSLMGAATMELSLAKGNNVFYNVGDTVKSANDVGLMDMVTNNMMPQVNGMLPKVDSIMGNVNALTGNVNAMISDPAVAASVARLDAITAELAKSAQQLTVLMNSLNQNVPGVMNNVNGIASNLTTTTGNLNTFTAGLNKMPLDSTVNNLNATIGNLQTLTGELNGKLNDKNSSLGLLLNDKSLYNNADHAISSLDSLFIDVKKNPKRYINLKVF